jgi:putative ABC transport system ATP-binding protein
MPLTRRTVVRLAAAGLLGGTALSTALVVLKVLFDITIPGLYLPIVPQVSDVTKVIVLWLPTAVLVAIALIGRSATTTRFGAAERPGKIVAPSGAEDGGPIAAAQSVVKVYDTGSVRVQALRGVDFTVQRGEMVAVVGPSGSGKTTLLNCLSGIDDITEGDILIDGRSLTKLSDTEKADFRAENVGFVFQAYNLIPVLRAAENVELPLLIMGTAPKDARRRAVEALKAVGLEEEAMRRPAELSGGQQQRVAIARALVNEPSIVFADEPTGNLDSETSRDVMALLRRLNKERGHTFVLVTHDPNVARVADRVVSMRSGRIEKEYRPTEF